MKKLFAMRNRKGFTLVELMVVVAIMGVLVAVAIPVYNNVTEDAQVKACATTRRTIESAFQMAKAQGKVVTLETMVPAYIAKTPVCPAGGTYAIDANGACTCTVTTHK